MEKAHTVKYEPRLTVEEETALARRAFAGDKIARNQLVMAHLGIAKAASIKAKCREHGRKCDDMEQVAFVALCKAAEKYDPDHESGTPFRSYAYTCAPRACFRGCQGTRHRVETVPLDVNTPAPAPAPAPEGDLAAAVAGLGGIDAIVLTARYPLDGGDKTTLRQIGAELGCTKQRVQRIEARALGRLRYRVLSRKESA
jgi:RNA polymerase sigma factor (sigma-70 family)